MGWPSVSYAMGVCCALCAVADNITIGTHMHIAKNIKTNPNTANFNFMLSPYLLG